MWTDSKYSSSLKEPYPFTDSISLFCSQAPLRIFLLLFLHWCRQDVAPFFQQLLNAFQPIQRPPNFRLSLFSFIYHPGTNCTRNGEIRLRRWTTLHKGSSFFFFSLIPDFGSGLFLTSPPSTPRTSQISSGHMRKPSRTQSS